MYLFNYYNEYLKVKNNREKLNIKFKDLFMDKFNDKNFLYFFENKIY